MNKYLRICVSVQIDLIEAIYPERGDKRKKKKKKMVSFVDALFSRYADPKYMECNSCELFIIGSLSPGKSGERMSSLMPISMH